jgi:DDE superfamily endonuclease
MRARPNSSGEVREPIRARSGQIERYDCEYKRNGTANLFIVLDVNRPWRKVKVTDSRTAIDFAICMRELADVDFPAAKRIRVVLDNLSIHSAGALYRAFPACEARRLLRRPEFHYVPKHASWLNMVEIEVGVLRGQCLNRRIATKEQGRRDCRLATTAQCLRSLHQMDVHNRKSPRQNGPRLPQTVRPDQRVIITVQRY